MDGLLLFVAGIVARASQRAEPLELLFAAPGHAVGVTTPALRTERVTQLVDAREALGRVALHRADDDRGELHRHAARQLRLGERDGADDLEQRVTAVRRLTGRDLVKNRAEEVDVGALGWRRAAAEHLGRHVVRRSRHHRRVGRDRQPARGVVVRHDGEAPIDDVDLAERADHDVLGLEVAVQHTAAVSEAHRVAHLERDTDVPLEEIVGAEARGDRGGVADQLGPRDAVDLLEDDERRPVGVRHDVVDGDDVRVVEIAGHPRLAQEPFGGARIAVLRLEALDGDLAVERALAAEPHDAHPAFAERAMQLDARRQRSARREQREERARVGRRAAWRARDDRRARIARDQSLLVTRDREGGAYRLEQRVHVRHAMNVTHSAFGRHRTRRAADTARRPARALWTVSSYSASRIARLRRCRRRPAG